MVTAKWGSGYSTAVERTPNDWEVMGTNTDGCLFLSPLHGCPQTGPRGATPLIFP